MSENTKTPRIRFKGFTDAWEQRKLGKIANEVARTDPESNAPIMMITANNGFIEQSDRYAFDNAGESLKKYILLEKGELAYNHGASKLRPYGSCFALTTVEKARIPFVYHCFSAKNYNSEFLSIELNGENVEKQLRRIVSSGARMDGLLNISFTEYSTITLSLPKRKEQDKISNFFSILDNLITLHQCKYFLCSYKNVIFHLQQSISKMTNSWEQRKLCDIAEKVTEKNVNTNITETFTNSAEFGIVSQRDYFDHDISNFDNLSGYYVVQNDDFVYNPRISTTAPVGPINRNKLGRKGVMSPLYTVFRVKKNIDFTFLEWYFKSECWHGFMRFNGDSGARSDRFSIKDEIMFQMSLPYPDGYEQENIGELLSKFDNLITLHQRKVEKLKNIKSALLEKMFV